MARKTDQTNVHDFTKQIHSTRRTNTVFEDMDNWNEKLAKQEKRVCCHDCVQFSGCHVYVGRYHKPCNEFEWW